MHRTLLAGSLLLGALACTEEDDTAAPTEYEGDAAGECNDGADNDHDGAFDCDDPDCDGSPDCENARNSLVPRELPALVDQAWHPACSPPAVFGAVSAGDAAAIETADELAKIHGDGTPKALDILGAVRFLLRRVMESQRSLLEGGPIPEADELKHLEILKKLTSRRAPYTMLIRSRIHPRFHHLFD